MKRFWVAGLAILAVATGVTTAAARSDVRTIEMTVRHSRFEPSVLEARRGEEVRFVVRNEDPIDHELIVGPMSVQDRHESGRERWHPPVPGEVSVALFSTAETTYEFDEPGVVWFGCHLPGHWAYGMQGSIIVR